MCGAGKSTTAQKLSRQFEYLSKPHRWIHEEIAGHPIRDGEFEIGSLKTLDGMDMNVRDMYRRWQALANAAAFAGTYIIEGCFIHAIDRYFCNSAFNAEQTLNYFDNVSNILTKAAALFVYLRSPDVKATLNNVFPIHGQWWKDLILSPEEKFFQITEHKGDETSYEYWNVYQEIADEVFKRYPGDKLMIEVPNGSWATNAQKIMNHMEMPYAEIPSFKLHAPECFCGKYSSIINGKEYGVEINYDKERDTLYAKWFWPYMKLTPITPNLFEMESFPITFAFFNKGGIKSIAVTGDYDCYINGNTLKISS